MADNNPLLRRLIRHQIILSMGACAAVQAQQSDAQVKPDALDSASASDTVSMQPDPARNHYGWQCVSDDAGSWKCHDKLVPGAASTHHLANNQQAAKAVASDHPLDWVPEEFLTQEQQTSLPVGCCGAYIEPERTDADANTEPNEAPVRISSDAVEAHEGQSASMVGDVLLTQGWRQMEAGKLTYHQLEETAVLEGSISLREPGLLVRGDKAQADMTTDLSRIENAQFVAHEFRLRGGAEVFARTSETKMELEQAQLTSCEPESNAWVLKASEMTIDSETEWGTAKHARINAYGVPIFYTPYMTFPVSDKRKSGLLFPSISTSEKDGLDYTQPIYLNLAENYDATVIPRYIHGRGFQLGAEFRHLSSLFSTQITGAHLSDDDGGSYSKYYDQYINALIADGTLPEDYTEEELAALDIQEDDVLPYKGEDRWVMGLKQIGGLGQDWYSLIDYTEVSDQDYFRDMDTKGLEVNSQTQLRQLVQAGYNFDHWNINLRGEQYQLLAEVAEQYKRLPELDVVGNYQFGNFQLELDHQLSRFDHADVEENATRIVGSRARVDYKAAWDQRWIWGFIKPTVGTRVLSYRLEDNNLNDDSKTDIDLNSSFASLDTGLYFERDGSELGSSYTQTFEPRLFYLKSEYVDHEDLYQVAGGRSVNFDTTEPLFSYGQLFRDSRFVGGDRLDDSDQLSVGLTKRFISNSSGLERLKIDLGQIFYFEDRQVTLTGLENEQTKSEVALQLSGQLSKSWRLQGSAIYDPYTYELRDLSPAYDEDTTYISKSDLALRYYNEERGSLFNIGYRFQRNPKVIDSSDLNENDDITDYIPGDIRQGDLSMVLPIGGGVNFIGRSLYDFNYERELESFAGFEFDNCCYRLRLVARKWLDNSLHAQIPDGDLEHDRGVFFDLEFKGLGSGGGSITEVLDKGIFNYKRREKARK